MFNGLKLFFARLKLLPLFFVFVFRDIFKWLKGRRWEVFEGWGLHIYLGSFGQGKTCSMVRDAYNLCSKYKDLRVLTNLKLCNFPKWTVIEPLTCARDILNAPDNTLVLIDEIGTIFNSRDFAKSKESVPKLLFQHICQCRHRHLMIFGTVQRWGFLDKQLRDIAADVTVCSAWFPHPFSRMITNRTYDAYEYDLFCTNPLRPLLTLYCSVYIQTDKVRALYDTKEMVDTLLQMEYVSDEEVLANQAGVSPALVQPEEKKQQRKTRLAMNRGGLLK